MLLCRRSLLLHRGMGEVSRPCPALLFASLLLSYHVFLALTSLLFFGKNYFCRKAEPLSHASRSPFRGAFFDAAPPKPPLKGEGDRLRWWGSSDELHSTSLRSGRNFSCPYSSRIRLKLCISCTDPYPHWLLGYSISDRRRQPRMRYARI